jgi:hypothetical protein
MPDAPMTVVETGRFLADSKSLMSANLSQAERNAMKRLIPILVSGYPAKD